MNINENELDEFLGKSEEEQEEKVIKQDKSLIERVDKKIIVEDGRQLLI
jgi:hypothetical protein